jgi:hypothetical protein
VITGRAWVTRSQLGDVFNFIGRRTVQRGFLGFDYLHFQVLRSLDSRKEEIPCTEQPARNVAKIPLKAIVVKFKTFLLLLSRLDAPFLTPALRWESLWAIPWALEHQNFTFVDDTAEHLCPAVPKTQHDIYDIITRRNVLVQ